MSADETQWWGSLVGGVDVPRGKTKRLEVRIKGPDERHRYPTLLIMRHLVDGRAITVPLPDRHAREFAQILDAGIRMLEEQTPRGGS